MDLSVQNDDKAVLCSFDLFVGKKGALIGNPIMLFIITS